jgi:hypothetical protein
MSDRRSPKAVTLSDAINAAIAPNSVIVDASGTDAERGAALVAAYEAAKLLTPNGSALSARNRASVVIPPAFYDLTTHGILDLDTDFVDLIALVTQFPSPRKDTDDDPSAGTSLDDYRPGSTVIYSTSATTSTVTQTASDVRIQGFCISQLSTNTSNPRSAFLLDAGDHSASQYESMYFWIRRPAVDRHPVGTTKHVQGYWKNCVSNAYSWRVAYDVAQSGQFSATMVDCEAGFGSYIGDYEVGEQGTHKATNCTMVRCKSVGQWGSSGESGAESFSGCAIFGNDIDSGCYFEECEAGPRSFGLGATCEGTFIRCVGGDNCFGASVTDSGTVGVFAGYAEDCRGGKNCFGGQGTGAGASNGRLTGELVRCVSLNSDNYWFCEGATIRDCRLSTSQTSAATIYLFDSTTKIYNSTILVPAGSTSIPIDAGDGACNVVVANCTMNNASNDADGLGADVTNLVATPYNVVSNAAV